MCRRADGFAYLGERVIGVLVLGTLHERREQLFLRDANQAWARVNDLPGRPPRATRSSRETDRNVRPRCCHTATHVEANVCRGFHAHSHSDATRRRQLGGVAQPVQQHLRVAVAYNETSSQHTDHGSYHTHLFDAKLVEPHLGRHILVNPHPDGHLHVAVYEHSCVPYSLADVTPCRSDGHLVANLNLGWRTGACRVNRCHSRAYGGPPLMHPPSQGQAHR